MARVSTYLNFERSTEDAFNFYRSVFGTQFSGPIMRFGDIPSQPGQPATLEADRKLVMHIELPILAGHVLMGTDAPKSMGFTLTSGNTVTHTRPDRFLPRMAEYGGGSPCGAVLYKEDAWPPRYRGLHHLLCEGGPNLLSHIVAAGQLHELCLTLSPLLFAGPATRILDGPLLDAPEHLTLHQVLEDDSYLFLRYLRR